MLRSAAIVGVRLEIPAFRRADAARSAIDEVALAARNALTFDAANTVGPDHETGRIADVAVSGNDPTKVDPISLKDITVLGTVSEGTQHLS